MVGLNHEPHLRWTVDRRNFLQLTGLVFGSAVALSSCAAEGGGTAATTEPASPQPSTPTVSPTVAQGHYSYVTVRHPQSVKTTLYGINNNGETVGYFADGRGVHGFRRSRDGSFAEVVDHPAAGNTTALFGVSDAGDVVGYYHAKSDQGGYPGSIMLPAQGVSAFVYSVGSKQFEPIAPPEDGTGTVAAFGINDSGLVSGLYFAQDPSGRSEAIVKGFVWSRSDRRHVDTFQHQDDAGDGTFGMGINDAGLVVGQFIGQDKVPRAFVRDGHRRTFSVSVIDHPKVRESGGGTSGLAISDSGVVAGFYLDAQGAHGYVRADQNTFVELRHPEAATDMSVCGINSSGTVVGDFYDGSGSNLGYLATPA